MQINETLRIQFCNIMQDKETDTTKNNFCYLYKKQCMGNLCSVTPNIEKCQYKQKK